MALRLSVLTGGLDPPPSVLVKGRRAVIGRGASVDVRIPDPSVSPIHATVVKRGEAYLLTDESSQHGTGVASEGAHAPVWLPPDSPRVIEAGERIWIGQIELRADFEAPPRGAPTGMDDLAVTLVRAGLRAAGMDPTPELVESTLKELTDLPEESLAVPDPDPQDEPVGVAALGEEDRHPPWKTDLLVAGIALVVLAGCLLGMVRALGTT